MKVRVRWFASLREAFGAEEFVEMPAGATLAELRDALIARGGAYAERLARDRALRCALDQAMAEEASVIAEGAEVAFFPPVTGG
ncbi:MAG: hypothetical protein AMXMBFR78_25210 [Rubrivivax sp.]|jgi:molybdopterin synthase sulfur carrier subunit|nr:MoaD/ThiS family protein [Rubrivivax sp.]